VGLSARLVQVAGQEPQLHGAGGGVGQRNAIGTEDHDAPPGCGKLLEQPLRRLEHADRVHVLGERVGRVLGIRQEARVERPLELIPKNERDAGPEGDQGSSQEPGIDQRQPGPD